MILAFDSLLVLALVWLAWRALSSPDLFKGIVLFIAFGLSLSLVWVRLNAVDVALAEAAVGSGLTGALLLSTLGRLNRMDREDGDIPCQEPRRGWTMRLALQVTLVAVAALLGWAVYSTPTPAGGLAEAAQARLGESGVTNPVTAVLLNFRAYDTLLEIGVLLLAVVAVWSLATADIESARASVRPVQTVVVNLLAPVMLVAAGYLLWIGSSAPGGAFQAGSVLGGAGVLLVLTRPELAAARDHWLPRGILVLGTIIFVVVGVSVMAFGRRLLEYPLGWAGILILVIEAAATLSIGATLAMLFVGGRPDAAASSPTERKM